MDRGDWAGIQDVLPVPSINYEGGSIWVESLDMTWESPVV